MFLPLYPEAPNPVPLPWDTTFMKPTHGIGLSRLITPEASSGSGLRDLVLSIQTFWCAYRLRELIGTAVLIEERDPERTTSKLIYLWSGVLLKKSLENENSKHKLSDQSLITKNHLQKRKRLRLVIYWIWIVIAVAQLAGLKDFSYYQVVIYGILGCFLVLFAQMYQWRAKSMSIYH